MLVLNLALTLSLLPVPYESICQSLNFQSLKLALWIQLTLLFHLKALLREFGSDQIILLFIIINLFLNVMQVTEFP